MSRMMLRDLEPGREYRLQVRAKNDLGASQWSQLFNLATIADTMPPAPVTSLAWEVEGTAFKGTWAAPTTNQDGTDLLDFKDFRVRISSPTAPTIIATYYTAAARFDLPFEANLNCFGAPQASVTIEVCARDNTGNLSSPVQMNAVNPPPADVEGLQAVGIVDAVSLRWSSVPDLDLKYYRVFHGTSESSVDTLVYTGLSTSFVFDSLASSPQYFEVFAVDVFNTHSVNAATANATPKSSIGSDVDPPANVTDVQLEGGINEATGIAYVDVSWTGVSDSDLQNYIIRYSTNSAGGWTYINVPEGETSARINNLSPGTEYYIGVATVDYSGNSSGVWVTSVGNYPYSTTVDTTPPSKPSAPAISANTMQIQVSHDRLNDDGDPLEPDLSYLEVYASSDAEFVPDISNQIGRIDVGPAMVGSFPIPANTETGISQEWFARVVAVDRSGNRSIASEVSTESVPLIANINIQDATISNAKINSLAADKLIAGTAFVNDLFIESELTVNALGAIKSDNFDDIAKTGYRLDSSGLIINDGRIEARAIMLQNGSNMIHPAYADFEFVQTWYDGNFFPEGITEWSIETDPDVTARYNTQALMLTRAGGSVEERVYFSSSSTEYNQYLEQNNTYILSMWAMVPVESDPVEVSFGVKTNDAVINPMPSEVISNDGVWKRISGVFDSVLNTAGIIYVSTFGAGTVFVDGVQIEQKNSASEFPSQWKPPSYTSIDGGIIRTGEIRSTASANGISGQPAWLINTQGNAQFGDALVRGRLVVGDPNNPESDGPMSRVFSSNYTPGEKGWIIRSDGYAEFRNLAVNSISVTAMDSPFQNLSNAKMYDYMQDFDLWLSSGAVEGKTDPGAYSAESLFEFTGKGHVLRNGNGVKQIAFDPTILYRVSARIRAFEVATLSTNPGFDVDTSGWTATSSATIARDTSKSFTPPASLRIDRSGSSEGRYGVSQTIENLGPDRIYTVSSRILPNSVNARDNIYVTVTWYDQANQVISSSTDDLVAPTDEFGNPVPVDGTTWLQITSQVNSPADTNWAIFQISAGADLVVDSETTIFWLDDVTITTPPRANIGVFGFDEANNIVEFDYIDDLTTPDKKHPMPTDYAELANYTNSQYMTVASDSELQIATGDASTTADWTTLVGYFRGRGGSGSEGTLGTPGEYRDQYDPAMVNQEVRYLVPYVEFDIADGSLAQLDQFSLEAFDSGAPEKLSTANRTGTKGVTIQNLQTADDIAIDHAVRFYTGDNDEKSPGVIGHLIDSDNLDASALYIAPPIIDYSSDYSNSSLSIIGRNPNLVYNSSFAEGIDGHTRWSVRTQLEWEQDFGREDNYSLKLTVLSTPATGVAGSYIDYPLTSIGVDRGEAMGASVWANPSRAQTGRVQVSFYNEENVFVNGVFTTFDLVPGWNRMFVNFVIPDEIFKIRVAPLFLEGGPGDTYFVDDFQVETGITTAYRPASSSRFNVETDVMRSRGPIIIGGSDFEISEAAKLTGNRRDIPQSGVIAHSEAGSASFRLVDYTDSSGSRVSTSLTNFSSEGNEESALRLYGVGDARFPGQAAICSPNGDFAISTQPSADGDLTQKFDTRVHGKLYVDGGYDWTIITSPYIAPTNTSRNVAYAVNNDTVYLRGQGNYSASVGDTLFTLPPGFRPPVQYNIMVGGWSGGTTTPVVLTISSGGVVSVQSHLGNPGLISFFGASFPRVVLTTDTGSEDTTAPGSVSGFSIAANSSGSSTGSYRLSWTNPSNTDTAGAKIIWRTDRYPNVTIAGGSGIKTLTTDGTIITVSGSAGQSKTYNHTGIPVNRTIYYRVVAYDRSGNHSSFVSANRYLLASPITVNANSSASYRLTYGGMWRNDGDDVYQGDWSGNDDHRGLFFYGTQIYDRLNSGGVRRIPTRMTIYLRRSSSSHGNNSGVGVNLRHHGLASRPSGDPIGSFGNEGGAGSGIVSLSRGQSATITIPNAWYNNFSLNPNSGTRYLGLGVYGTNSNQYMVIDGRSNGTAHGRVTIHHNG